MKTERYEAKFHDGFLNVCTSTFSISSLYRYSMGFEVVQFFLANFGQFWLFHISDFCISVLILAPLSGLRWAGLS